MQIIIKEHIKLGLIEPGVSIYSSPGFLIKMESESKRFTAFSTPQGQYIWNVLPMGLANAPQIFQRKMDNLFKDYFEFIFVYIDDILIASKNMKDHIKHLEIFSDACHREGLVLSEKKATIAVNKIEFLGILIDETGIFIKDLAKYRKDFRPLLKETESSKWKWKEIHTQRVRELKKTAIRSSLVASTALWNDLREPIGKVSPSGMTNELREHDPKHALRVQGSKPVAADSSTACTRPSSDSDETAILESQGVQNSDDSSQPNTSAVKDGEISLRPMTDISKRPDMVAFNKIKVSTGEAPLVSAISEDDISTRRA
ncbi:UNVERIFIED_CONTAM: putative enzymatic polyprotein [Sesamum radiatum]|uniref:Enzymatic polyprotein n=1 Tax=Sesamum radiatum TaxID=300843 RepID=A0AAW2RFF2_SESRA